jgi:F-type H+-transporting ATPase subunit a
VTSEQVAASPPGEPGDAAPVPKKSIRNRLIAFLAIVVALNVVAFILVPPFPVGEPGQAVSGISDLITANLELPAPHVLVDLAPDDPVPPGAIVSFHPSITNTIFTTWCVMAVVLLVAFLGTRGLKMIPGRLQNLIEFTWESLENWATSLGGSAAAKHIPLFVAFFLFILISNWSGLLPFFGRIEAFRAPTSDLNITLGLALVAFFYFHFRGFQALGFRGYLGKFFVLSGFRNGLANGVIDMFVGLIEFMLEFIKPITLAMRLFGNIYGGEVALGVITALTLVLVPVAMVSLEVLLNLIQALIFSTLALMYTLIAIEGHHDGEAVGTEMEEALEHRSFPAAEAAH